MKKTNAMLQPGGGRKRPLPFPAWLAVCLLLLAVLVHVTIAEAQVLTTAAQVRELSAERAEESIPVQLRGVVTFFDESLFSRFIQDETAGIYLRDSTNTPALQPGQLVEVRGVTSPGEYAPVIIPAEVSILGEAVFPVARQVSFEQMASGREDSQFVEVEGIVRSVVFQEDLQHHAITLATGGGRLTVFARKLPVENASELVDATVRVRGVCSTQFNRQRQLFAICLMVPRSRDLVLEQAPARDPFAVPVHSIGSLLQFTPQGSYGHRVKVLGTLVYQQPGNMLYIQGRHHGLQVRTEQKLPLQIGDRVEVLGFPAQGKYTPILEDAIYRVTDHGPPPKPTSVELDDALSGRHDCRLVRIEARLLDRARQSPEQFLVLDAGGFIFHAHLEPMEGLDAFQTLENGSMVGVTGICLIEPGDWQAGESWRARSFQILLRSPADVEVLKAPPWWTLGKLLWMTGLLFVVILASLAWVGVLRRRVGKQTQIIRQQLEVEAALKERYLELFENANDMVFTHDLNGRLTSINHTGELLLQRSRDELLSRKLVDMVTADQQAAARQWMEQVVNGAELSTAEWDFVNGAGQRIKMEISARLIAQNGKEAEVEGIARDITERRRLERQLLEISNREQRRIGHDLHDGVCQQLAGIAYLVDVLGDKLQEKAAPEASEAEKIGALINEATVQARGVARGLFPVRLEESGLVSALEDLADNAARRFRIECIFRNGSPPSAVDNDVALHLYYIAQEALLNAAKHGKAARVEISLQSEGERHRLRVKDDGRGFILAGASRAGMGIRIMRYRAKVIGATLSVESRPGAGTDIVCLFHPVRRETAFEMING